MIRGFEPGIFLLILFATVAVVTDFVPQTVQSAILRFGVVAQQTRQSAVHRSSNQLVRTTGGNFTSAAAPDAASLFNSQCAKCHGRDGRAKTKRGRQTHTRDITGAEWQNDVTDERIFNSISRGKGKMPAFKKLSDAQIDSLVSYVRRLRK